MTHFKTNNRNWQLVNCIMADKGHDRASSTTTRPAASRAVVMPVPLDEEQ